MEDKKESEKKNAIMTMVQDEKSITRALVCCKDRINASCCPELASNDEKKNKILFDTVVQIVADEKLKPCFDSLPGKLSIMRILEDTVRTGLVLGKLAYAIPQPIKVKDGWVTIARHDVKAEGYRVVLTGGKQPIFSELSWWVAYEKDIDSITVDEASGEVTIKATICADRGDLVGIIVQAREAVTGKVLARFISRGQIESIRNAHSKTWQKYQKKELTSCTWETDFEAMCIKTALKKFTKPWALVSDYIREAIYNDNDSKQSSPKGNASAVLTLGDSMIVDYIDHDDDQIKKEKIPHESETVILPVQKTAEQTLDIF